MKRLICALLAVMFLCGCAPQEQLAQETVFAMDTVMELKIWGADSKKAVQTVKHLLKDIEEIWSAADADSVLSKLNREEATLTETQKEVLAKAKELSRRTGGAFDPKLHRVISLWGFMSDEHYVPTQTEIENALSVKQWNLGAAVKGYAGQLAVERLQALDVDRAVLNLGGNVQTYGEKPDGSPWQIGIQDPNGGDTLGVISVTGTASVVTSGNYQRYFEKDGVRYHHILDPETGYPADSGLACVTVICRDGMTADVLSTALYVMGLDKATEFWRQSNDFEAVLILSTGEIYATEGAALSGCEFEVICREN